MLSWEVDPKILLPRVPTGTELDLHDGRAFVSIVGFRFLNTRVRGLAIPGHRDFDEVNLRFYVGRHAPEGWRRGVVFIKELVPRAAIAWVARRVYGENYHAVPMRHSLEPERVQYQWHTQSRWQGFEVGFSGEPTEPAEGSEESFITEHYWGYASGRDKTIEYQVEHPPWRVWQGEDYAFDCEVAALYGDEFAEPLAGKPSSIFVADGSEVIVRAGSELAVS